MLAAGGASAPHKPLTAADLSKLAVRLAASELQEPGALFGGQQGNGIGAAADLVGIGRLEIFELEADIGAVAAEIEHSLMVQYLFAAYSMGGPQVPEARRDDVNFSYVAAWEFHGVGKPPRAGRQDELRPGHEPLGPGHLHQQSQGALVVHVDVGQLLAHAKLNDLPTFEDQYLVGPLHRRQAVGNNDRRAVLQEPLNSPLEARFGSAQQVVRIFTREAEAMARRLRELGLERDTVVMFTSDNGPTGGRTGGADSAFLLAAAVRTRRG